VCLSYSVTSIIKQVASNKSSLLLKIQKLNTKTLQLFIILIKMESVYKSNKSAKLNWCFSEGLAPDGVN
jgi:hypothetical protein